MNSGKSTAWVVVAVSCALLAFAANSLLGRMALAGGRMDPASFTLLRLAAGAAVLLPLVRLTVSRRAAAENRGSWGSGIALFVYAAAFSFAYTALEAGTGALVLFGAVQATMIGAGLAAGERLDVLQWCGLAAALTGLTVLVAPGLAAPEPVGAGLMAAAGVAWGVYSLRGRGARSPLPATAANFLRATPFAVAGLGVAAAFSAVRVDPAGILLAVISGSLASGLGYVAWYAALPGLTAARAAVVQLLVPVLAAAGGVALLGERFSFRLAVSAVMVLGGVAVTVLRRFRAGV